MRKIYILIIILLIGLIVWYSFSAVQNRSNIPGGFEEKAYIRNENNRGNVLIYYAFSVKEPLNAEYHTIGETLPANKDFGVTKAYFFDANDNIPTKLQLEEPHFDTTKYKPIAIYTIHLDGNRELIRK